MRKTQIILPTVAFVAGLLTGAAVFSQPGSEAIVPTPAQPEPVTVTDEPPVAAVVAVPDDDAVPDAPPVPFPEPEPEVEAEPPALDQALIERAVAAETAQLRRRVDELSDGWGRMQEELVALQARLVTLERRPMPAAGDDDEPGRPAPPATVPQRRELLIEAGVAADAADELIWRQSQTTLGRLELRDIAAREGWLGTERYREELRALRDDDPVLRDEIGVDAYDQWLYLSGANNRISVDRVIPGGAGEEVGLAPGDIVERYDGEPVFNFQDLRTATSTGQRDELVPVQVRRGGELVELWIPRGPIGIQLDATRAQPLP